MEIIFTNTVLISLCWCFQTMKQQTTMISVKLDGTDVFCHTHRRTTCSDVIKMVAPQQQNDVYVLFESRDGVEKMLAPNARIHKLMRSWGAEQGLYSLVAKPDFTGKLRSRMASIHQRKRKLQHLRSYLIKAEMKTHKLDRYHGDNFNADASKDYKQKLHETGPSAVLSTRTRGDGVDSTSFVEELPARECGDGVESYSVDMLDVISYPNLDTGFIADDPSVCTVDLNQCFIDSSDLSDSEDTLCDVSNSNRVCDLERNVIDAGDVTYGTMTRIRDLFRSSGREAYSSDDEMESFMNTFTAGRSDSEDEFFSGRCGAE